MCGIAGYKTPRTVGDGPDHPTRGALAAPGVTLLIYMNNIPLPELVGQLRRGYGSNVAIAILHRLGLPGEEVVEGTLDDIVGKVGDRLTSYFRDFGKFEGEISDTVHGGFLLELEMTRAERAKLAEKLVWLEKKQKDPSIRDSRRDARFVPMPARQRPAAEPSYAVVDWRHRGADGDSVRGRPTYRTIGAALTAQTVNGGAREQSMPLGGFKQSGLGREGGRDGVEAYTEIKIVTIGL